MSEKNQVERYQTKLYVKVKRKPGFLMNIAVSLALPTLAPVNGRSLQVQSSVVRELAPEDLTWDPAYELPLMKLTIYFAHLELPVLSCQERLICELTADPDTFFPISQIFMKELRLINGPVTMKSDSLMWKYMTAAREGFTSPIENCARAYASCPVPAERIINMPQLRLWQYFASRLNIDVF
nr:uncharacterized protein LOC128702019 [Cherax quadricarinatus]